MPSLVHGFSNHLSSRVLTRLLHVICVIVVVCYRLLLLISAQFLKLFFTAMATRIRRLCYLPRRKGVSPPLAEGLRHSAVSNVAASRYHLQMTRRSRRASRSSVGVHPPNPTKSQPLDRLRRVRADLRGMSVIIRLSSTSNRVRKKRSSMKEKLSKGAGNPASNTLYNGSSLG